LACRPLKSHDRKRPNQRLNQWGVAIDVAVSDAEPSGYGIDKFFKQRAA
jgi:hypothetical protein